MEGCRKWGNAGGPRIRFFVYNYVMTVVIKRYPNRKLYDTVQKQYITLDSISDLIREGADVQVVDYASGEDLTAVTLTQIIFEQEKKQAGFLPRPLLAGLVKAGGETVESVRRSLTKPLDLLAHVDDEISRRLDILVEQDYLKQIEAEELRGRLIEAGRARAESAPQLDQAIRQMIREHTIPSRGDFNKLVEQLEGLTQKVDELGQDRKP